MRILGATGFRDGYSQPDAIELLLMTEKGIYGAYQKNMGGRGIAPAKTKDSLVRVFTGLLDKLV
jgi:hypothetical protein